MRRLVYLAIIQVPFAGVEFVVERLAEHGLIRRRPDDEVVEPGVELDAFIAPSAIDLQAQSLAWMDSTGSRRVFYLLNSEDDAESGLARMSEAAAQSEEEARERIRQAVLISTRQRAWFANLSQCEECAS